MNEDEKNLWRKDDNGVYWVKYPTHVTVWNVVPLITSIINDYINHRKDMRSFLVMVDASSVIEFDETALLIGTGKVGEYVRGSVAVYNMSEDYKNIISNFYKNHDKPSNIMHFSTKEEALAWLTEQSELILEKK